MGYLRRVLGVTLRDKEHRAETREAQDTKPLLRIERSQLWNREIPAVQPCVQNAPGKIGEVRPSGYSLHRREAAQSLSKDQVT